jgi:hypothetical protein
MRGETGTVQLFYRPDQSAQNLLVATGQGFAPDPIRKSLQLQHYTLAGVGTGESREWNHEVTAQKPGSSTLAFSFKNALKLTYVHLGSQKLFPQVTPPDSPGKGSVGEIGRERWKEVRAREGRGKCSRRNFRLSLQTWNPSYVTAQNISQLNI